MTVQGDVGMPRRARIMLANTPVHIIQRGKNKQACFYHEEDYRVYLDWLNKYSQSCRCSIHAYVLMSNHVHLLLTSSTATGASEMMKRLGQRYAQYFNRAYQKSGTLWDGRFKSCLIEEGPYLMSCYRYIESTPVMKSVVEAPEDYPWSSYHGNGKAEINEILTSHALYKSQGVDTYSRQKAYRELFRYPLDEGLVKVIGSSTNGNAVLGSEEFQNEVEAQLGRRVTKGISGRPCSQKNEKKKSGMLSNVNL